MKHRLLPFLASTEVSRTRDHQDVGSACRGGLCNGKQPRGCSVHAPSPERKKKRISAAYRVVTSLPQKWSKLFFGKKHLRPVDYVLKHTAAAVLGEYEVRVEAATTYIGRQRKQEVD